MSGEKPVLYVLKRFPRLSETFVLREILGLEEAGERVLVEALLPPETQPRHPELDRLQAPVRYLPRSPQRRDPGVRSVHLRVAARAPLRWAGAALRAQRLGTWRRFVQAGLTADRIRRERVRHVHAHFATAASEVARDAARLAGVPFTVTAHAKDVFAAENAPRLRRRLGDAAAVVTVSAYNAAHLRERLPGVPVVHVPNGVPLGPASGPDPAGPVLCVARLVEKKAVDVLVEACARLSREPDPPRVEVIGTGPLRYDLDQLVAALGVRHLVTFRGALPSDEVAAAYARASVAVLPCRIAADGDRDGMPTVLVEALARGLPVVSTDVVGIPELVEHGVTGLLVPPDDPDALAAAIAKLVADPALAATLGRAGRARVAERFDPAAATAALRAVFGGAAS